MLAQEQPEDLVAHAKLSLLKSPLVGARDGGSEDERREDGQPNLQAFGDRKGFYESMPEFQRHEDASLLELFFDLFFAANYTVFSETNRVTDDAKLKSFVGYFAMLWITWLMVGFYDVRFLTDSLFERIAKALHLGVMVGFAVVAPKFNPEDQTVSIMRAMSLILFVSRMALALEYSSILWHVRKFRKTHVALYIQIGAHILAAFIYLGVTFAFHGDETESKGYVAWYVVGVLEAITTLALSNFYPVLSFTNTHLMRRISLLTVIILGDGIVVLAQNVVTIVEGDDSWNSLTIGVVTAAAATIYAVFLIYFDWMKHDHLPAWRQQLWTAFHFPFHLALVLFVQGFNQFVIWTKIFDELKHTALNTLLDDPAGLQHATSEAVANNVSEVVYTYFESYTPKYVDTWNVVDNAVTNITSLPNAFWRQLVTYETTGDDSPPESQIETYNTVLENLNNAIVNALFDAFKIDIHEELAEKLEKEGRTISDEMMQNEVAEEAGTTYAQVFVYAYVASGCALALMTILTIISRVSPWKTWPIIRTILNFLIALAIGLIALLYYNENLGENYLASAWVLPTLCIIWFIVLVLTHIHGRNDGVNGRRNGDGGGGSRAPLFFSESGRSLFHFNRAGTTSSAAPQFETTQTHDPENEVPSAFRKKPVSSDAGTSQQQMQEQQQQV